MSQPNGKIEGVNNGDNRRMVLASPGRIDDSNGLMLVLWGKLQLY